MDVLKKVPVREQDAKVRAANFEEVCLGYNKEEAMEEAARCINCKNAQCIKGCPVSIDIPGFIEKVKDGDVEAAYQVISESSALPAVCGRVCPQESQCEGKCIRGIKGEPISIGKLERFVADWAAENGIKPQGAEEKNGKKVAVIGSGPAGLTCAGDLAKMGYGVTIFEALHEPGGVLVYGIPEFRLPKTNVVAKEIENVKSLGVKIETNVVVGKSVTIDELLTEEGFDAVFIGSGAGLPKFMGIPGEQANGVFSANEYLTRSNLMKAFDEESSTPIMRGKKVAVVGGGNVAMDAARTALRLGAEVHIVYRRSEEELPARVEEVHHAKEEGIIFDLLTNPVEILEDEKGWVKGIRCIRMELGEPDESGRRRPVEVPGSEFTIDVDTVIMSLGTSPNPLISSTTEGLEVNKWKCIIADETFGKTTKEGVYAGGDAVTGAATVILAMGAGRAGAKGNFKMAQGFTWVSQTVIRDKDNNELTYNDADKTYSNGTVTYSVTDVFGVTGNQVQQFNVNNITQVGTSANYAHTDQIIGYELDYNQGGINPGTFNYIGTAGNNSVGFNMGVLGTQFQNINIDFSTSTCYENGDNCTLDLVKGDVSKLNGAGKKLGDLTGLNVAEDGRIFGTYDNGNTTLLGQIAVAVFANPSGLEKLGDNCYRTTLNSGDFDGIGQEITADGGKMTSGVLEMSNVDLSTEFTEMITTQRGFQANSRIITTSDTLLEELVNLKR